MMNHEIGDTVAFHWDGNVFKGEIKHIEDNFLSRSRDVYLGDIEPFKNEEFRTVGLVMRKEWQLMNIVQ